MQVKNSEILLYSMSKDYYQQQQQQKKNRNNMLCEGEESHQLQQAILGIDVTTSATEISK